MPGHRLRPLLVALSILLAPVAQGEELGTSLDGLLAHARAHSIRLLAPRLEAEAASARAAAAGALPDPRARIEWMDLGRADTRNPGLLPGRAGSMRYTLMQDLPWPGKRALEREIAASEAAAADGETAVRWSELAAAIGTRYAQLYFLDRDDALLGDMLDLVVSLEQSAQARHASGLAAQQDVIRAQLEGTALRARRVGLAGERRQLQAELNALLGRPAQAMLAAPTDIAALPDVLDRERLERGLRRDNPRLRTDAARVRAAEGAHDRVRRERYPDFSLGLTPTQYGHSIRAWDLMLELDIPLQRKARQARERESEARLAVARAQREDAAQQLVGELGARFAAFDSARESLALIDSSLLPQAELTLQSALAGYENGQVDFATLLDAQKQILEARLERNRKALETRIQLAEIDRLAGVTP